MRSTCLYGTCGSQISCTDGHYAYILAPADKNNNPLYNYTLMPTHMRSMFPTQELQDVYKRQVLQYFTVSSCNDFYTHIYNTCITVCK